MPPEITQEQEAVWLAGKAEEYLREGDTNMARLLLQHALSLAPPPEQRARIQKLLTQILLAGISADTEAGLLGGVLRTPGADALLGVQPAPEVEVRRTPHIDIERADPLVKVSVYLDTSAARPGEQTEDVVVKFPPGAEQVSITVRLLVSDHFELTGPATAKISVRRDADRSDTALFQLRSRTPDDPNSAPWIMAIFEYQGRPSGRVTLTLPGPAAPAPTPAAPSEFAVTGTTPADLTVTVAADPANDGRRFWCTVHSPHLPAYADGVTEQWNLPETTWQMVKSYMDTFTASGIGPRQRVAELLGAGIKLFRATPEHFQKALWALIDSGKQVRSISIVSEEPFIPWELMVPRRPRATGGFESRKPLGVEFAVGRWIRKSLSSAPQQLHITDSYVVAPQKYPPRRVLKFAEQEVKLVLDAFPGQRIDPADFDTIDTTLSGAGRTLIHFACHGLSGGNGRQTIALDDEAPFSSDAVVASAGFEKMFGEKRPVVFLNACETGRPETALVGIGGFAEAFVDLGASAVIAALWSVKDGLAHEIARDIYAALRQQPNVPIAETLRSIRAKAYDENIGEDTYAAYCFYGDPNAVPSFSEKRAPASV